MSHFVYETRLKSTHNVHIVLTQSYGTGQHRDSFWENDVVLDVMFDGRRVTTLFDPVPSLCHDPSFVAEYCYQIMNTIFGIFPSPLEDYMEEADYYLVNSMVVDFVRSICPTWMMITSLSRGE